MWCPVGGLTSEPDSESSFRLRLATVTLFSLSSELDRSTYADISESCTKNVD